MNQYSELQVALINARDGYEKRRSNFTDPKDKRVHKRQCDLISAHIMELPELTAARDEAERLRANLADVTGCACDAESLCKYHAMATTSGRSTILRKQAEAVEDLGVKLSKVPGATEHCHREAQRLRQQAAEAEKEKTN